MKTKKLNKKILAVLMSMMMCMSGFQITAFADTSADVSDSGAVSEMSAEQSSQTAADNSSADTGSGSETGGADISGGTGSESGAQAESSASNTGTVSNDTAAVNSQTAVSSHNSFVSSGNDIVIVDGNVTINNNTPESNDESSEEGADSEVEGGSQEVDNNLGSGSGTDEESGNTDADSSAGSEDGTDSEVKGDGANNDADTEDGEDSEVKDADADSNAGSEDETNNESGISAEEAQANVAAAKAEAEQAEAVQTTAKGEADSAAADVTAAGADVDKISAELTAAEEAVSNAASEEEAAQAAAKLEEVKAALSQAEAKLADAKAKAESADAALTAAIEAFNQAQAKLAKAEEDAKNAANQGTGNSIGGGGGAGGGIADSDKEQGDAADKDAEKPEEEKPDCEHEYANGVCIKCEAECPHEEYIDGKCVVCGMNEPEKLSETVQAFLNAVKALPEEVTAANFEEVFALMGACQDAYDALSSEDLEREDVNNAIIKMAALMEAASTMEETGNVEVRTCEELISALESVKTDGTPVTIVVSNSIEVNQQLPIYAGKNVILQGASPDVEIFRSSDYSDWFFLVQGSLALKFIALNGYQVANSKPLVYVYSTGTFTMEDGSAVRNNTGNNYGSGVYNVGGTFIMNGGAISGNKTTYSSGSGGVYNKGGTFKATGGTISGNTGGSSGSGGVYSKNIGINMSGTEISNNVNGGIVVDASGKNAGESYTLSGLTITGNTGSKSAMSVKSAAMWNIQNCTITDNEITGYGDVASVVYVAIDSATSEETDNVLNNCIISKNTTSGSAALYISCGSGRNLQIIDCTITDNTGNNTGGVCCGTGNGYITIGTGTRIEKNNGKSAGGLYVWLASTGTGCVTVDGAVVTGNTGGTTGGVYTTGSRFEFKSGAIYGNTGSDFVASGYQKTYSLIKASEMTDPKHTEGYFSDMDYSWAGAPAGQEDQGLSHTGKGGDIKLTAQANLVRNFAKIGDTKYETLEAALAEVADGGIIDVILGEDDLGGKYEISKPIQITKSVTLVFKGQEIISKDGGELFTIGEGVTLNLQGNAMMGGRINVKDGNSLVMDGSITPYYYSNGSPIVKDLIIDVQDGSFTINGTVACLYTGVYLKVNLAAGKCITAGEGFAIENTDLGNGNYRRGGIRIALDDETYNRFNNAASDEKVEDVVLIEGCKIEYVLSRIFLTKAFTNDLVKVKAADGNIVLNKATITDAVFVDGQKGDNSNFGTTSNQAVKDLEKAKALLGDNTTIYVTGELTLSGTLDGTLPDGKMLILKRYPGYKGDLVKASDLTVTNIILDGSADDLGAKDNGALLVVSSGTVTLGEGAELRNNASKGVLKAPVVVGDNAVFNMTGGKITGNKSTTDTTRGLYSEAAGAVIIYGWSDSSVGGEMTLYGGEISGNTNSAIGGAITLVGNAKLTMDGGKITGNISTGGRGVGHGGGVCLTGRTGGMSQNYDAQCVFTMNGGEITGNEACYGGGIYVNSNHVTLNAGTISNNKARETGGGVYVETPKEGNSTAAQLNNALITGNTATEMGGGLYFCPTGTGKLYVNDGAAIYDNSAIGNPAAADDLVSVWDGENHKSTTLSERMLGGGKVDWYNDGVALGVGIWGAAQDAPRYDPENPGQPIPAGTYEGNLALKAVVSDAAKALAKSKAELIITGNTAVRGGGVGANGSVTAGTAPDPDDPNVPKEYTLKVNKKWDGVPESEQKAVKVQILVNVDGTDYELDTVELNANNNWTVTLTGLPESVKENVSVKELTEGYAVNYSDPETNDNEISITVTNKKIPPVVGSLKLTKTVVGGSDEVKSKPYTFEITGPAEYKHSVVLKNGESETIYNLTPGEYTVTEADASIEGYTLTVTGTGNVSVVVGKTVSVEVINTYEPKDPENPPGPGSDPASTTLVIPVEKKVAINSNNVDGEAININKEFSFTLAEDSDNDSAGYTMPEYKNIDISVNGDETGLTANGEFAPITFTKAGNYTFTVTEQAASEADKEAGWNYDDSVWIVNVIVGLNEDKSLSISKTYEKAGVESNTITFTNIYNKPEEPTPTGTLTITKIVQGGGSAAADKVYTFTVTGPNGYSKSVIASVNKPALIEGLAPGTYTVTEDSKSADISGYRWSVNVSVEGVMANGASASVTVNAGEDVKAAVTFTNTYRRPPSDPDDPTPPTPTTPENPPTTPEEPPTDVPDPDVPLVNIPEEPPVTDIPEEEPPLANIPEEEPPLVDIPEEEPPLSEIPEEEPPLAEMPPVEILDGDVPKTGDTNSALLWLVMSLMALFGMGTVLTESCVRRRRK